MNWYKQSQVTNFDTQTESNIGGPNINVYPYEPVVKEVVDEMQAASPGMFDHVSDIIVDVGHGQFGSVQSTSPNTIRINMNRIKNELATQGWSGNEDTDEYKQALKQAIQQVIVHEHTHTTDFDPETGQFPGGESVAEQATSQFLGR